MIKDQIKLKQEEFTAFESLKSTYITQRDDFNTKLAAAEASISKVRDNIFKLVFREGQDVLTYQSVPPKPSNPSVPAAYNFYKNSDVKEWGTVDGGWGHYTTTDLTMSQIRTGKSFGVLGNGRNDGQTWSTADYGVGVKYGATHSKMNTAVTPNVCYPHYMVLLAAPGSTSYTMTTIKVRFGAYDWLANSDLAPPTTPTKAADPNAPKSAGASHIFVSSLLCLGLIIF